MIIRQAKQSDFGHLETFVWQAIFPAFDQPDLSAAQRAENDALVETAREEAFGAMERRDTSVLVAIDPKNRRLAGYVIVNAAPSAYAEINTLIIKRSYWGKGVAAKLMQEATNFIGRDRAVSLAVRHYNGRAIAFFAKHDFVDTGETTGDHAIPRTLMLREAYEVLDPPATEDEEPDKEEAWYDFPSAEDEPVFEQLPDYRLAVDETPLFSTGSNALSTSLDDFTDPGETTLTEKQLTDLEAFIARARAKKGVPAPREDSMPVYKPKPVPPPHHPRQATAAIYTAPAPAKEVDRPLVKPRSALKHNIPFEVDFGDGRVETNAERIPAAISPQPKETAKAPTPSFEFAFDNVGGNDAGIAVEQSKSTVKMQPLSQPVKAEDDLPKTPEPSPVNGRETKHCPDCAAELPVMARFCYACGYPQPENESEASVGEQAPDEDFLVLEELPDEVLTEAKLSDGGKDILSKINEDVSAGMASESERPAASTSRPGEVAGGAESLTLSDDMGAKTQAKTIAKSYSSSELRQLFREHFQETVIAYFGDRKLKIYYDKLEEDAGFQQLRDGSLGNLLRWLNEGRPEAAATKRIEDTLADLTEYFIVETAADLSGKVLPQRLLRHQSVDWETVDLFKLVMDYLDFERESERVYTDFVTMPERSLRNATRSFLKAGKDERVFLICDQSLISQAKNGFAVTDSGLYWKTVLQPAGRVLFKTLEKIKLEQGHLKLDGQFFNAGASLNLKLALLLKKLGRM